MLQIRPLQPEDSLSALTALLHRAYARLAALGLNYTAVDQDEATTARRVAGGHCLLAFWEGQLAGTVLLQPTYAQNDCAYFTRPGVAALHQFAVEPGLQGHGIGRALMQAGEHWARGQAFGELALDAAEPATHLVSLYQGLGYEPVSHVQWPGKVYRSVVMSKRLGTLAA